MLLSRLPLIAAIILGLLIGSAIYWQMHPYLLPLYKGQGFNLSSNVLALTQSLNNQPQDSAEKEQKNYNIAGFKLFGDAAAPLKQAPVVTENLPATTLRLTLTGVLAGKNNILASALIEGPDRQTRNYRIEDEVPGGAILKEVHPDRVVLQRAGRLENLIFEETRPIGIEQQYKPEPVADRPVFLPENLPTGAVDRGNFTQQQTQQIKDRLSRLRNRLQNNEL